MVTRLWAEKSQVQILGGARYFFFQNFQTDSEPTHHHIHRFLDALSSQIWWPGYEADP